MDAFDDALLEEPDASEQELPPVPPNAGFQAPPDRVELKKRTKAIQQLLAVFLKAGKTLRLYDDTHRFFENFVDQFMVRVTEQLDREEYLTLEITPSTINWDGSIVFDGRESRESLAFKLHRDGVRLLQFVRGIDRREVREFVTLIARETDRSTSSGQDLSILFWESDFKHIRMAIAETFVEYTEEAERLLAEVAKDLERLRARFERDEDYQAGTYRPEALVALAENAARQVADAAQVGRNGALSALAAGDGAPGVPTGTGRGLVGSLLVDEATEMPDVPVEALDDDAMIRLYEDLHGLENLTAEYADVGVVLAEVVDAETDEKKLRLLLDKIDEALSPLLATAAFAPLNAILRRLALATRRHTAEENFRAVPLRDFFTKLGRRDRLALLAESLNARWDESQKGELFTFISVQHPDELPALLELVGLVNPPVPREVMADGLLLLTERDPQVWLPLLRDDNWRRCVAAIRSLHKLDDPILTEHIAGAIRRSEPEVRRAVLSALRKVRGPRITDMMLAALEDESDEVRLESLRYLTVNRVKEAMPFLTATMAKRSFHDRRFEERRGWYMALGHLAGKDVLAALCRQVEQLSDQWNDKAAVEKVHLALLGIRSTRMPEGQKFIEAFASGAKGELRSVARQVLGPKAGARA